jgi:hypothetical protein
VPHLDDPQRSCFQAGHLAAIVWPVILQRQRRLQAAAAQQERAALAPSAGLEAAHVFLRRRVLRKPADY